MVAIEISGKKAPYAFGSGFCYSFFRYDTGNIGGGGYIEGRAVAVHVGWGRRRSEATADFIRVALLDGNPRTIGGGWVKRTTRSRDVERHAVGPGEDGDAVGADLVGHVAVGGDPVGPGDDQIDPARLHQRADHAVAQQGDVETGPLKLPGS